MSEIVASECAPRFRVIIVDDDDDVREALEDELEGTYDVTAVASGREALGCLDRSAYDAIISDQRMPGMSGVHVLQEAFNRDAKLVRILLTGHVDEDARQAMMQDNAPYKIGKPWHDEVEVTLKRAFEHRAKENALSSSVTDALAVAGVDDELSTIENLARLAQVVVRRCHSVHGVTTCQIRMEGPKGPKVLAGDTTLASQEDWSLSKDLTSDGSVVLLAQGSAGSASDIVEYLASRARQWSTEDSATRLARRANTNPEAKERLNAVSRRATLGTMTAALVHDLASVVQSLQGSMFELEDFIRETATREDDEEVVDTLENAVETCSRMVALFRAMRTFVRSGEVNHRPCTVSSLVERSVALCHGQLRSVVRLEVSDTPTGEINANEALFLQVLVNILKNAAEASEQNGVVHLDVEVVAGSVVFKVRDFGEGVSEDVAGEIFEPFTTTKSEHSASGLGLAISADIVADHQGTISYEAAEGGGTRFIVTIPLCEE